MAFMESRRISVLPVPVAPLVVSNAFHANLRHDHDLVLTCSAHVVVCTERLSEDMRSNEIITWLRNVVIARGPVVLCDILLQGGVTVDGEICERVDRYQR